MVTVFTIWLETFGNGAAIGTALITTRRWPTKGTSQTTRRGRTHHLILPSLTRKSGCIAAARSSATTNIAHAISSARAVKVRSIPEQITSVFDAFDLRKTLRSTQ